MPMNGLFLETKRCPDGVDLERGNVEVTDLQHGTTLDESENAFVPAVIGDSQFV